MFINDKNETNFQISHLKIRFLFRCTRYAERNFKKINKENMTTDIIQNAMVVR